LIEALWAKAESYGALLHLNTVVRTVRWSGAGVTVNSEPASPEAGPGSRPPDDFSAAAVVITVPLSILKLDTAAGGIHFVPDLPISKQTAVQGLAVGNVIKINLLFRERFWEEAKVWDRNTERVSFRDAAFFHYPDASLPTWWTQLPIRAPLLVGWTGGPPSDRLRTGCEPGSPRGQQASGGDSDGSGESVLVQAIQSLASIFRLSASEIEQQLEATLIHDWATDPFSRGAYSYVPVNGLEAQRVLSQPIDNKLFFAGEATCKGHIGTVHGAIQSGQRAAAEVLQAH
jgi:monoamine oxidase